MGQPSSISALTAAHSLVGAIATCLALAGCSLPGIRANFESLSPAERARAIAQASQQQDNEPQTVRGLIMQLDSADPAVRMLAIGTLRQVTGERFGYDWAAPTHEREAAIQRWVVWQLEQEAASAASPSGQGGV